MTPFFAEFSHLTLTATGIKGIIVIAKDLRLRDGAGSVFSLCLVLLFTGSSYISAQGHLTTCVRSNVSTSTLLPLWYESKPPVVLTQFSVEHDGRSMCWPALKCVKSLFNLKHLHMPTAVNIHNPWRTYHPVTP